MKSFKAKFAKTASIKSSTSTRSFVRQWSASVSEEGAAALGKSLVYFFILSAPVDFSIATVVIESILSQPFVFNFQWFSRRGSGGCGYSG